MTPRTIDAPQRLRQFARRSAAVGALIPWTMLLFASTADSAATELIHRVAFFAMLTIVPLGLSLVMTNEETRGLNLYRVAVYGQPIAALLAVISFLVPMGLLSAALAAAWLLLTAIVGLLGLTRLLSRGLYPLPETSVDAGLLYLPVAGVWLVVYRLGIQPFDYGETIILLTVIHFHFAGFAAPIIAGMVGRTLATSTSGLGRLFPVIVVALVASMPLVAAGITFSPWLGLAGALLLTTGLLLLAVLTIVRVVPMIASTGVQVLLVIGALSSCAAMVLACLYSYSLVAHIVILTIPAMAKAHGLLNAFGFATCSLVGWTELSRKHAIVTPSQSQAVARPR